jgi:hypothetical protein
MIHSIANILRITGTALKDSKYIREKSKGKPGEKNYKPPLWYWISPSGKKKLVDQKAVAES